ncbi:hypothetical protein J6590_083345, partial [Homalodisca vitripennis]
MLCRLLRLRHSRHRLCLWRHLLPWLSPSIAIAEPQSPPKLSPRFLVSPSSPTTPWTLPDSYAEAVRSSPPIKRSTSDERIKSKAVFRDPTWKQRTK